MDSGGTCWVQSPFPGSQGPATQGSAGSRGAGWERPLPPGKGHRPVCARKCVCLCMMSICVPVDVSSCACTPLTGNVCVHMCFFICVHTSHVHECVLL